MDNHIEKKLGTIPTAHLIPKYISNQRLNSLKKDEYQKEKKSLPSE